MEGTAEIALHGELLPAYVTDAQGNPLPLATMQTDSGFDYLAAPEPAGGGVAATVALALLGCSGLARRGGRPRDTGARDDRFGVA